MALILTEPAGKPASMPACLMYGMQGSCGTYPKPLDRLVEGSYMIWLSVTVPKVEKYTRTSSAAVNSTAHVHAW